MIPNLGPTRAVSVNMEVMMDIGGRKLSPMYPDNEGYYNNVPIGALGTKTRKDGFYDVDSFVAYMDDTTRPFKIMLDDGGLYGENGHPENLPNTSAENKARNIARARRIDPNNYACFYRSIKTRPLEGNASLIVASLRPFGHGEKQLRDSFADKYINTAFSLRSITKDEYVENICYKRMIELITFDHVGASGYKEATKRFADPTLSNEDVTFTVNDADNQIVYYSLSNEGMGDSPIAEYLKNSGVSILTKKMTIVTAPEYHRLSSIPERQIRNSYYELFGTRE